MTTNMRPRRPKGFDKIAWDAMPLPQRVAEAARAKAIAAAFARKERQEQRLQRQLNKRQRLIRDQYEAAVTAARNAYREAEEAAHAG